MLRAHSIVLSFSVALLLVGCGSKNGSDVTITGDNGEKVTVNTKGDSGTATITDKNGEQMTVDSKNGEVKMSGTDKNGEIKSATMGGNTGISEAELGVPFYPGSTEKTAEQMKVETGTEKDYLSCRTTSDEPAKVLDFYKDKVKGLTGSVTSMSGMTMAVASSNLESGAKFTLTAERKDGAKETEIKVAVVIKKK